MDSVIQTPLQAYRIGDVIDFKVRQLFPNYCELIDEKTGITSYLQGTANLLLHKRQTVTCRVLAIAEKHPKIELVNISDFEQNSDCLNEEKLTNLLNDRSITWNYKDFVSLILSEEKEQSYESQCHKWIQSLLNKKIDLQIVRTDCANLLEMSNLLNLCSNNERDYYQERLTFLIEQIGYYIKAGKLIDDETSDNDVPSQFVDNLYEKLRVSGFVYHPSKNFNILCALFLRRPELMNNRIKELLEIICGKDIKIWEKEPFCSALIQLLELYIDESEGKIDKVKDNRELIDNNSLALSIQLLLINDSHNNAIADYRLNRARLCLLSSYTKPLSPLKMVNAAYYHLFHSSPILPVYTVDNIKLLPHFINGSALSNIDTINTFTKGNMRLQISDNGIHIQPSIGNAKLHSVFPQELGLWKGVQVYLQSKPETSLSSVRANDILPYQSVWQEIESDFFNTKKTPVFVANKNRKQHRIEDTVRITFTGQDPNDKNKYYCQIEDETGGEGFIYVKDDIVSYSVDTSLRHFYDSDGSRYVFEAKIIEKEDDLFHFSMSEELKDYCSDDFYTYDEDIICSVGGAPNGLGMSPAVSNEGLSVSLRNAGDFPGITHYDTVRCRLIGSGTGTFHISCDIIELVEYDFDLSTAFKTLMKNCSVGQIPEAITDQEDEQILDSDKLIDESYVKEVIYMIDRMALIDSEYIKSFNYLGFARILCLMIGWESQAAYYKGRMDIITMLHDFAQNSRVDEDKLKKLENANAEQFSNNAILKERFQQLQTVSFIDKDERNPDLFDLASKNPSLKNLASLVLAYNITKSNRLESCARDIHNKIFQLLNLKGYETGLKLYGNGEESEDIEFKTSFIYHAEDKSGLPNPDKQKDEILQVINSFFNTRGGTLYIGVNDSGYGVGVESDLTSSIYNGNPDKYIRSVVLAVANEWGHNISTTYMNVGFDKENTDKDVVIVEIKPIISGLPYKNVWYVRQTSSKLKLTKEEFEKYQKLNRKLPTTPATETVAAEESKANEEIVVKNKQLVTSKDDEIKTSRIRTNVLDDWQENYVNPIAYFKFLSGGKFIKIDNYDYTPELLTLAVKEVEGNGYLVLGYEDGRIVKVPVDQLIEYNNREYSRYTESKLIFASIAQKDDAVLTISKENKTHHKTMMRLDRLSNFEDGKLMDKGKLPFNEGLASEILAYDIIPNDKLSEFKGILDKPKTTLGYTANNVKGGIVDKLHSFGINEI